MCNQAYQSDWVLVEGGGGVGVTKPTTVIVLLLKVEGCWCNQAYHSDSALVEGGGGVGVTKPTTVIVLLLKVEGVLV